MTVVGSGGVVINRWQKLKRFHKDYDKLTIQLRDLVDSKLQDLAKQHRPPGLAFEKLKGYSDPDVFTIHINGNYKLSLEISGGTAYLRRVGNHNDIDLAP